MDRVQQVLEGILARLQAGDPIPIPDAVLLPDTSAISCLQGQLAITAVVQEASAGMLHLHLLTFLRGKESTRQPETNESCLRFCGSGDREPLVCSGRNPDLLASFLTRWKAQIIFKAGNPGKCRSDTALQDRIWCAAPIHWIASYLLGGIFSLEWTIPPMTDCIW